MKLYCFSPAMTKGPIHLSNFSSNCFQWFPLWHERLHVLCTVDLHKSGTSASLFTGYLTPLLVLKITQLQDTIKHFHFLGKI